MPSSRSESRRSRDADMMLGDDIVVGVVGAGAMGTGIAHVAAAAGHRVILGDASPDATANAKRYIDKALDRDVDKNRISRNDADALRGRIEFLKDSLGDDLSVFASCGLVIEAIVEAADVKQALFSRLEDFVPAETVLATNTS